MNFHKVMKTIYGDQNEGPYRGLFDLPRRATAVKIVDRGEGNKAAPSRHVERGECCGDWDGVA